MTVKQNDYVDAARVVGDSRLGIFMKDVLPNSITPVVVQATMDMGNIVLVGATLSFIGLAEAGLAEWGVLVAEGQAGISAGRWWASTFPGLMVFPLGAGLQPRRRRSTRRARSSNRNSSMTATKTERQSDAGRRASTFGHRQRQGSPGSLSDPKPGSYTLSMVWTSTFTMARSSDWSARPAAERA